MQEEAELSQGSGPAVQLSSLISAFNFQSEPEANRFHCETFRK